MASLLLLLFILCFCGYEVNSYKLTSSGGAAKGLVGVLTGLTNLFSNSPADTSPARQRKYKTVTQAVLCECLRNDFKNSYLFTGNIDPEIYAEKCMFTDPTLSFTGLRTFETNLRNLQPYITRLIGANVITLYDLDRTKNGMTAKWRMECCFALPWRPVLDLCGETTYTVGRIDGRIVDYSEKWVAPSAASVLLQLLRSDRKKAVDIESKLALVDPSSKTGFRALSIDVKTRRAFFGGRQRPCGSALLVAAGEYAVYSS